MSTPNTPSEPPTFSIVDERSLVNVSFLDFTVLTVQAPDGSTFERVAIRHPGAVAVVAIHEGAVLLIEQYRAPVDATMLELPAGKLDIPDEDPAVAAVRELEEEVGHTTDRVEHLMTFYTGPGFTDELIHLYLATELRPVASRPHGVEEEAARVVPVPVEELPGLLAAGAFRDAKTIAGLQAFALRTP